ncbi:imidazoleglycerol-phosphate dehydratase HisB [Sulfuriroseicoccus oceanibius]|uniref:Imidazoleglycerol-phosphate dehydratase n=1 Tax=Sulfuriroseicoccus oceanibius TaxID=2707525 RepID=A0A6B3LBR9_9BACT|nr:imidazoleglycerol-phosphate dehydratase HisB [Sulfuriroseicoccus oceanibius]QQL43993.1 imidazoleglycerol-phosphate dehydratase HisB [Sulfuriroseicoccus oceanibius]
MARTAEITRETAETQIRLSVNLDGTGKNEISTGIGFFDHMLDLLSRHSLIDLVVEAKGDLEVDLHHTVEDTGIVLGQAIRKALGDKAGIRRYGWSYLPMDETLARVVVDLGGRPFQVFELPQGQQIDPINGNFPMTLVEEFFRAVSFNLGANVHSTVLYGRDAHHMAEAIFKGFAKCLYQAVAVDPRIEGVMSTKETI